jgi:TMEM175 potassium channel family protein
VGFVDETPDADTEVEFLAAERLTFFSDAVVAIAMTLLALELTVPRGATNTEMLRSAGDHWDDYLAFLVSFAVIASHWFSHNRTFRYVIRLGGRLASWNMLWLLMIVTTPFATRVLTSEGAFETRFVCYAAVQTLAGVFSLLMLRAIARHGLLRENAPPDLLSTYYRRAWTLIGTFGLSICVAFFTQWAYLCWAAIPLAMRAAGRIPIRRRTVLRAVGDRCRQGVDGGQRGRHGHHHEPDLARSAHVAMIV